MPWVARAPFSPLRKLGLNLDCSDSNTSPNTFINLLFLEKFEGAYAPGVD